MSALVLRSTTGLRRPRPLIAAGGWCAPIGTSDGYYERVLGMHVADPYSRRFTSNDPWLRPDPIDRRPWWVRAANRIGLTI